MDTLAVAVVSLTSFYIAYHTYGRWLSRSVFQLDRDAEVPSRTLQDDVDFVPTRKSVIFGHHFTSIAGTGPIVGPALAVFWGWLPALLWVVLGAIFIGAVHDFGALVVSLRNRGQTVGEVAGRLISRRARVLFLVVLFFSLTVVLAIFGLVIATIFIVYPSSVLSVWIAMPLAVLVGFAVRRGHLLLPAVSALAILYLCVYLGVRVFPIALPFEDAVFAWTLLLMGYCFLASVLPVWVLLQPRDFINSQQLFVTLLLLVIGLVVASVSGQAPLLATAPAVATTLPADAPPMFPFLFITVACGACSGFHCLVSSGTSSKQISNELDAQYVAFGSMLLEGALAVLVILACTAGLGMGVEADGETLLGRAAWLTRYAPEGSWGAFGLCPKIQAFVDGGANFVSALGIPRDLAVGVIAVLVASFAATTLDSATRLQRYVVQELGATCRIAPLTNKYVATSTALGLALLLATVRFPDAAQRSVGLILWQLFGATNQLLAGLAFMVTCFYLWRRGRPVMFAAVPMGLMLVMPAWAMAWKVFHPVHGWWAAKNYFLVVFGVGILLLQAWMIVEAILLWPRAKGVLEDALPPLPSAPGTAKASGSS